MSLRLRKSFSPIPGVRVTLSPRGISTSVGAGPLRFTVGPQGSAVTARIPGSGISYRHKLGGQRRSTDNKGGTSHSFANHALPPTPHDSFDHELQEVASEGTALLTTPGLHELLEVMRRSKQQREEVQKELEKSLHQRNLLQKKLNRWSRGFFLKRLRKQAFAQLQANAESASAEVANLENSLQLSTLHLDVDAPGPVMSAFHKMCDHFAALSESKMIWDTTGERASNRVAERTAASRIINRQTVSFGLKECPLMNSAMRVPHLENANGGDIYIYPNFVIYFVSENAFALLEIGDLRLFVEPTRFIEDDPVPEDSSIVGQTWHKANKDGSPDRRFANNYQIPVVLYAKITIQSSTGMNEEYQVSNAGAGLSFFEVWQDFARNVRDVTTGGAP